MTLIENINDDLKNAMKSGDSTSLMTLRLLKSAIKNFEIQSKSEVSDDEILKIIQKEIKQRNDSIKSYEQNNRQELADKELAEIEIIKKYLPEQLSDEELTTMVVEAITESEATKIADMGRVMSKIMPKVAGMADGNRVSSKVQELLSR